MRAPPFTIGLEEEYLLVDRSSRDLATEPPADMLAECEARLQGQISPEFLRCQIAVQTRPCRSVVEARAELVRLRRTVAEVAGSHGLAPIAAGTHPFAEWEAQKHTDRERYQVLDRDYGGAIRRLLTCGLHVHVGVSDDELRIDLMNQAAYFLPHLLALSTSSPFWRGEDTGLKSFRLAVFDGLPRTGLPEYFDSYGEYARHLQVLINADLIDDPSKLWWDIRPSAKFPTLEMRITDVCTRLDDAIAIAAVYQGLIGFLYRLRRANQRWRIYPHMLINENRWRAQRYGVERGLVDFGKGEVVHYSDLLEEMISAIGPEASRFGCAAEIRHAREILVRGTSADRQRSVFDRAIAGGASREDAFKAVVDWLIEETVAGL